MNKMDSLELDLLCVHTWVGCDKGLFIWRTDNFVAFKYAILGLSIYWLYMVLPILSSPLI